MVSRWKHKSQIAILHRRFTMTRAVLPRATAQELWLLAGQVDTDGGGDSRAVPLEEDADLDEYVAASEEADSMDPRGPSGDLVSDDEEDADVD